MQDQIISLLKTQDPKAINFIYESYAPALYGVVIRIVQTKELAEQVMQDTFLKAWKNGAHYDESKGKLFTWLLNIARNTAIDATRSSHFIHSQKTRNLESLLDAPTNDGLKIDTIDIKDAVNKLDEKYGQLIHLLYFEQYTHVEASEKTGIPLGTIKTRMRSAISLLRSTFL